MSVRLVSSSTKQVCVRCFPNMLKKVTFDDCAQLLVVNKQIRTTVTAYTSLPSVNGMTPTNLPTTVPNSRWLSRLLIVNSLMHAGADVFAFFSRKTGTPFIKNSGLSRPPHASNVLTAVLFVALDASILHSFQTVTCKQTYTYIHVHTYHAKWMRKSCWGCQIPSSLQTQLSALILLNISATLLTLTSFLPIFTIFVFTAIYHSPWDKAHDVSLAFAAAFVPVINMLYETRWRCVPRSEIFTFCVNQWKEVFQVKKARLFLWEYRVLANIPENSTSYLSSYISLRLFAHGTSVSSAECAHLIRKRCFTSNWTGST